MYGCESWTVKKAECRRIDAFELWCWRRLLRVPWTARRSNQSILKVISPGCSLEGLMLNWSSNTLATSCEELIPWKRPWCWEGLGAGGEGDDRGWDGWMASPTRWTWVWVNSRRWWWTGRPGVLRFMGSQRAGHDWVNWTELNWRVQPQRACLYSSILLGYSFSKYPWGLNFHWPQVSAQMSHYQWVFFQPLCKIPSHCTSTLLIPFSLPHFFS